MTADPHEWALIDEDTGEGRIVTAWCKRCYPHGQDEPPMLVSASGTVHATTFSADKTVCGRDCTGEKWMFRL